MARLKSALMRLGWVKNLYARMLKKYTTRSVVNTLRIAHAAELSTTPGEMWPMVRERQAKQIQAVLDGKLDIVDRRSWAWPYLPSSISRIRQPLIKLTPFNLRRFSKTPVPRRAINLIKYAIIALKWDVVAIAKEEELPDQEDRIEACKKAFRHPNNTDSFQTFIEAGVEDLCITGAMTVEPQLTPNPARPFKLWNVDSTTIRIFPTWTESDPEAPRYAQMTGLKGERGAILFLSNELLYIRDNPGVDTPFGTGKAEIAFQSTTSLLGVQDMAGRSGSDQTHRIWLWWQSGAAPQNTEIIRRHLTNDIEGQGKVNLMQGIPKPEVVEITPTQPSDLLLDWQEMLIRMIANSFDLSPLALGIEKDVNRNTSEVLDDKDFYSAVVPVAVRIAEAFTRNILHGLLGYNDLEFKFLNLEDPDLTTKMQMYSQLYAMSAETPNGARKAMGLEPLASPYADLTQFEMMLLNTAAASELQNQNATKAMNRQLEMEQMMAPPPEEEQEPSSEPSSENSEEQAEATTMRLPAMKQVSIPHLKPLPLVRVPKMPIVGSKFSAMQIASMSLDQLESAMQCGAVPNDAGTLMQNMENQEPGILMQMASEVLVFLKALEKLQQEKTTKKKKSSFPLKKYQIERYRERKHKPSDVENAMYSPRTRNWQDAATGKGREIGTTSLDRMRRP